MRRAAGLLAIFAQNTAVFAQEQTIINLPVKLDITDKNPIQTLLTDITELKLDTPFFLIGIKSCESDPECEGAKEKRTSDSDGLNITVSTVGKKTFKIKVSSKNPDKDVNADVILDAYTGLSQDNLNFPDDLFSARKNTIDAKSDNSFCEITKAHPDVEIEITQQGNSPSDISENLVVDNKTTTAVDEFGLVTVRRNYRFKNTSELANERKYVLKCVVKNYVPAGVTDLAENERTVKAVKDLNITEFVNEGPPQIISFGTFNEKNLIHGAAGNVRCEVTAMPQATVTIHRKKGNKWESIDVSREQDPETPNKMIATYAITEVDIAEHFGSYKCEANSDFQDVAVVNETFVFVTREFKGFKATTSDAKVGTEMSCKTQAYPKPSEIYWRAKGSTSKIDATAKFTYDEKTATANVNYKSTKVGSYECVMKVKPDSAALVVLYSVKVENKPIMSEILSNPTYYIIVGTIILLLIISVLIMVMLKRKSNCPEREAANPDVASTTVAASSDHDMEKGNVNEDKGGSAEQAALIKNEV